MEKKENLRYKLLGSNGPHIGIELETCFAPTVSKVHSICESIKSPEVRSNAQLHPHVQKYLSKQLSRFKIVGQVYKDGFNDEISFHPMTLDYIYSQEENLDMILNYVRNLGYVEFAHFVASSTQFTFNSININVFENMIRIFYLHNKFFVNLANRYDISSKYVNVHALLGNYSGYKSKKYLDNKFEQQLEMLLYSKRNKQSCRLLGVRTHADRQLDEFVWCGTIICTWKLIAMCELFTCMMKCDNPKDFIVYLKDNSKNFRYIRKLLDLYYL